jgi:hypothetical protein
LRSASRNSATVLASTPALRAALDVLRAVVLAALRACCWRPRALPPFFAAALRFADVEPELPDDELRLRELDDAARELAGLLLELDDLLRELADLLPELADLLRELAGFAREELAGFAREELAGLLREELAGLLREELAGFAREELAGLLREELAGFAREELAGFAREELAGLLREELEEERLLLADERLPPERLDPLDRFAPPPDLPLLRLSAICSPPDPATVGGTLPRNRDYLTS